MLFWIHMNISLMHTFNKITTWKEIWGWLSIYYSWLLYQKTRFGTQNLIDGSQHSVTQWSPVPASGLPSLCSHMVHIHSCKENTHTQKVSNSFRKEMLYNYQIFNSMFSALSGNLRNITTSHILGIFYIWNQTTFHLCCFWILSFSIKIYINIYAYVYISYSITSIYFLFYKCITFNLPSSKLLELLGCFDYFRWLFS